MESASPHIKFQSASLPPFWNRRVLFFSNLHSIFYDNVEETMQLLEEITGAHSYGGRVMCILDLLFRRRPNLMVLEVPPEPTLIDYLAQGLGISLPSYEVLERRSYNSFATESDPDQLIIKHPLFKKLQEHPAEWVDGFVTDAKLIRIAALLGKQTISTLEGSKNGNNKYLLYKHQLEQKLPVFDTLLAADQEELKGTFRALRSMGYKTAVVKAQIGASGYGMIILPADEAQAFTVPNFLFYEGPCMAQGWIEDGILEMRKIASPSVQFFLDDETVFLFDMTEQILRNDSVHQGNMSPPPLVKEFPDVEREIWRQAAIAGTWLHRQGYRGTGSVDFLIIERGGQQETIICEVNARVTGATYPALIARHFKPQGAWLMRNIRFRKALDGKELITAMDRMGVLFRFEKTEGMIPFNFNTDVEGKVLKGQFVCVGNEPGDCSALLERAWARLPVEWGYDRD